MSLHRPPSVTRVLRVLLLLSILVVPAILRPVGVQAQGILLVQARDEPDGLAVDQVTNNEYFQQTTTVSYSGGQKFLSGSGDHCTPFAFDDAVRIYVDGVAKFYFPTMAQNHEPVDISSALHSGNNQIKVGLVDLLGPRRGGSALYLVSSCSGGSSDNLPRRFRESPTSQNSQGLGFKVEAEYSEVSASEYLIHRVSVTGLVPPLSEGGILEPGVRLFSDGQKVWERELDTVSYGPNGIGQTFRFDFAAGVRVSKTCNSVQGLVFSDFSHLFLDFMEGLLEPPETMLVMPLNTAQNDSAEMGLPPSSDEDGSCMAPAAGGVTMQSVVDKVIRWLDKTIQRLRFRNHRQLPFTAIASWPGSNIELTLKRPDGSIVAPGSPGVSIVHTGNYVMATVYEPENGDWQAYYTTSDFAPEGEDVRLQLLFQEVPDADTVPPSTMVTLSGTAGNNGWFRSDVQVVLSAVDDPRGQGLKVTEYRFDDGPWTVYSGPLLISRQGMTVITVRSTDNAGNIEPIQIVRVRKDTIPPVTTATASGPLDMNGYFRDNVLLKFHVVDDSSGKDKTEFSLDGGVTWQTLAGVVDSFTLSGNGAAHLLYRSQDLAGNREAVRDAGVLAINKYLIFGDDPGQAIQFIGNSFGQLSGILHSNGCVLFDRNIYVTIAESVNTVCGSGPAMSGNINLNIVRTNAGVPPEKMLIYPVPFYRSRATTVHQGTTTFDSINTPMHGIVIVENGDAIVKSINVSGDFVLVVPNGSIIDQSSGNAFQSADPTNGVVLYAGRDITLKSVRSNYVGMIYAPHGTISLNGPLYLNLRGSLVGKKVQINGAISFDGRYDSAMQSAVYALPINSMFAPTEGAAPSPTVVPVTVTPTGAATATATQSPTQAPAPTATATLSPSSTATAIRTSTSVPPTATSISGATATPCAGVQPPTLLGPANGSTAGSLRPTLTWQPAPGAFYTSGQVSADPSFNTGVTTFEVIFSNYTPPSNLQAHTTYYWRGRSRALIPATYSNCWSPVWSFTTP